MYVSNIPWEVLLVWGACTLIGASMAKGAGRQPLTGAAIGLIFGPLGVVFLMLSSIGREVQPKPDLPPYQVQVYRGATQAEAARAFAADAPRAAAYGYDPLDQAWDGTTLTVTYRLRFTT